MENEGLSRITEWMAERNIGVSPVLPSWYETYKYGNLHYPRDTFGIFPLTGAEIIHSLQNNEVDLLSVVHSEISPEQFVDLENTLIHAHKSFNIPAMPTGHNTRKQKEINTVEWLRGNWVDIKTSAVRTLVFFGATKHPYDMDIKDLSASPANTIAYELRRPQWWEIGDGGMDNTFELFMKSESYPEILSTVGTLYDTAEKTLRDHDVLKLARGRKKRMSAWYKTDEYEDELDNITPDEYKWEIIRRMKENIDKLDLPKHNGTEASTLFLNAVTLESRSYIEENTRYQRRRFHKVNFPGETINLT